MLNVASLNALTRIADRANELLNAHTPGFQPAFTDTAAPAPQLRKSLDPLSVAAPPDGWFVVGGKDGARTFTRDGGFAFKDGALVTSRGEFVMMLDRGVPVPIKANSVDIALGRCTDVRVESDGTVAYTRPAIDPQSGERSMERVAIGRVALARFPAGTAPVRLDATHYAAPRGVLAHMGAPADGSFAPLATYSQDGGALDFDTGLARLKEAYTAFSALNAAHQARGKVDRTVMDLVK